MTRWIKVCGWFGLGGLALGVLSLPWTLPRALTRLRPDIVFRGEGNKRRLFLTIDDSPSPSTSAILAVLKKHQVPATFFVIGNRVQSDAQLSSIVAAGYSLGHHMRTTEACSKLSLERFRADFDFTDQLLRRFSAPTYFRPPSDLGTLEQRAYARSKGYQPILGTVFPLDHWLHRSSILQWLVRWLAVPGGVIIMHDGEIRGRTTAEVLDEVVPSLKAAGYDFEGLPSG